MYTTLNEKKFAGRISLSSIKKKKHTLDNGGKVVSNKENDVNYPRQCKITIQRMPKAPPISDDLVAGVDALVKYGKVDQENNILERIKGANAVHEKVYDLLYPVLPEVKTYMQGSGGQVQNALSLIGSISKKEKGSQKLENNINNFCSVYNPKDLDFSDIDILLPIKSTKGYGTKILMEIKDKLQDKGAEIRSAAVLGDNSSFSHIFLKMDSTDIDIVIQDMRFAEFYAPKFPHMAARSTVEGKPGFIKTHEKDDGKLQRSDSVDGFVDLTAPSGAEKLVKDHMSGGLEKDSDLVGRKFNFEKIKEEVEKSVKQFREELRNPMSKGYGTLTFTAKIDGMIKEWVRMKEEKSADIRQKLAKLEKNEEVEVLPRRSVSEKTEFRKNQKQYYKSTQLDGKGISSIEQEKSVVAFFHMLAQHLDPGQLDSDGVANFTASLLAKKGYSEKSTSDKRTWLQNQIDSLKSVHNYFGALAQMNWAPDNKSVENSREYFLKQQAIFEELMINLRPSRISTKGTLAREGILPRNPKADKGTRHDPNERNERLHAKPWR